MQQAGISRHSDPGQRLHQPQCFLEEKKLLKCLMWTGRRAAPVSALQAYRRAGAAVSAGRTGCSPRKCLSGELRHLAVPVQASHSHAHSAAWGTPAIDLFFD